MHPIEKSPAKIYVGLKVGKWTVTGKTIQRKVPCQCECGTVRMVAYSSLITNSSMSCGCTRSVFSGTRTNHGRSGSPIYMRWLSMARRCAPNARDRWRRDYYDRGIGICSEWKDFLAFEQWCLENGFAPELHLDRIDNNKGYSPQNCQWVTHQVNRINSRSIVWITAWGETKYQAQWIKDPRFKVSLPTYVKRIKQGLSPEDAMSLPDRRKRHTS